MKVVDFIKENGIEALSELGVKVKDYDDLIVLNYDEINSPKTNEIVRECRGLILEKGSWNVVCRPFKRFYNYGEAPDTLDDFSFERSVVMDKADGSLIKVYFYNGKWEIATRGTAFAESENYTGKVFRGLVVSAFQVDEHEFQRYCNEWLDNKVTYLYEFVSPDNRVVTPYENAQMIYLGSVENKTGKVFIDTAASCFEGCTTVKFNYIGTIEECIEAAKTLDGLKEGFVVRDLHSGQMVKIKSPLYVAAHHLRGDNGLTPKKIAKLVITGETEEYLTYFDSDKDKIEPYKKVWEMINMEIEGLYDGIKDIVDQKEFAIEAMKYKVYSSLFFVMRKGLSKKQALDKMRESNKIDLLLNIMEKNSYAQY